MDLGAPWTRTLDAHPGRPVGGRPVPIPRTAHPEPRSLLQSLRVPARLHPGFHSVARAGTGSLVPPCPSRARRVWRSAASPPQFAGLEKVRTPSCCSLGDRLCGVLIFQLLIV
ncbi:hypothetical protein A306_00013885 [Columba livia]|uniref:Uncharacterized protein n=1 Tax=Columba livia TaxID=8932 RepID=A0A2I0LMQ6_COLLI|nr:hypothetical protein A306_00013885 [Columba livia]